MTRNQILPLESARLVQYAMPVACYLCETDNTYDAEFCRHCFAPMALAHQARNQNIEPRMIAAMGISGAGKSVYLGMLIDMLSRRREPTQLLTRGAFSVTLQQTTVAALSRGEFPGKTPNEPDRWNWVHCQVRWPKQKQPLELIMPDMAGEAVLQEVDHPHTYRVVRAFLNRCAAAMIFIDALNLSEGHREQDYSTMKLLGCLAEMGTDARSDWRKRPLAIVFTKADLCGDVFDDVEGFARTHAPGLWQQCRQRFAAHRFFASGVAGACGYSVDRDGGKRLVPLRIEPRGITEPFEWLIDKLRGKR